jgi:hypothetical protein
VKSERTDLILAQDAPEKGWDRGNLMAANFPEAL